ncbi:MAG: PEP-CTERM sorting domain-containing protein [Sedimentisphaerales bacterium]|nr:PEP-CTERM sorting domain-containing protein [Sedimentisphaerales bacterium]
MKISIVLAVLLVIGSFGMGAGAVPISYDEAIDGDLDIDDPLFQFDIGVNRFSGSMSVSPADWDSINFSIPDGMELAGITASIEGGGIERTEYALAMFDYPYTHLGFSGELYLPFSGSIFDDVLPLETGNYRLRHYVFVSTEPDIHDYILEFNVIPEPSSIFLFAVAGLGLLRRRRQA